MTSRGWACLLLSLLLPHVHALHLWVISAPHALPEDLAPLLAVLSGLASPAFCAAVPLDGAALLALSPHFAPFPCTHSHIVVVTQDSLEEGDVDALEARGWNEWRMVRLWKDPRAVVAVAVLAHAVTASINVSVGEAWATAQAATLQGLAPLCSALVPAWAHDRVSDVSLDALLLSPARVVHDMLTAAGLAMGNVTLPSLTAPQQAYTQRLWYSSLLASHTAREALAEVVGYAGAWRRLLPLPLARAVEGEPACARAVALSPPAAPLTVVAVVWHSPHLPSRGLRALWFTALEAYLTSCGAASPGLLLDLLYLTQAQRVEGAYTHSLCMCVCECVCCEPEETARACVCPPTLQATGQRIPTWAVWKRASTCPPLTGSLQCPSAWRRRSGVGIRACRCAFSSCRTTC